MTETARLLHSISDFLTRYVVFPSRHQVTALALWVLHTWRLDVADSTIYPIITSPSKRSGKTRLLEVLELLVRNPFRAVEMTEAALFRILDAEHPTLMVDEIDAAFAKDSKQYQGTRAILNSGHRRGSPVPRVVGEGKKMRVEKFDVFSAKVLAGIGGKIPDTVLDRGVVIHLQRRAIGEQLQRFRLRVARKESEALQGELADWAVSVELTGTCEDIPGTLSDRAGDGWECLLEIADTAGDDWSEKARLAAVELHGGDLDDEDLSILLLSHIREAFFEVQSGSWSDEPVDRIRSRDLLQNLTNREEGPWADWWGRDVRDDNIKGPAAKLSRKLKPYGIKPTTYRDGSDIVKGYQFADFESVFSRYLSPPSLLPEESRNKETTHERGNSSPNGSSPDTASPSPSSDVTSFVKEQRGAENVTEPLPLEPSSNGHSQEVKTRFGPVKPCLVCQEPSALYVGDLPVHHKCIGALNLNEEAHAHVS